MGRFGSKILSYTPNYKERIADGGYGDIYKCNESEDIVIKLMQSSDNNSEGEFDKSVQKASKKHKNLMTIYGAKREGSLQMVYMEYLHGCDLFTYIENNSPLDISVIVKILEEIFVGIKYMHDKNIMHRDIKPENIYITKNRDIKILDFGLACKGTSSASVGTSGYIAPEMISGDEYDKKCDIWGLGVILYEMVENHFIYPGTYDKKIYFEHLKNKTEIEYNLSLWDSNLLHLCKSMLVYNPRNRIDIDECLRIIQKT